MKDKLKTLNDIGTDARFCSKLSMFARSGLREMLKQEAIKWVKDERGYKNKFRDARADVLMEIHNITEEDLK